MKKLLTVFRKRKDRKRVVDAKKKFKRFASKVTDSGEQVMTAEDFLRSVLPKGAKVHEADLNRLKACFVLADSGEQVMTAEDFLRSVLPKGAKVHEADLNRLKACFVLADSNNDGVLSFAEYFLFTSLMAKEDAFLKVSFKLFDLNGDGYITLDEFKEIIRLHALSNPGSKKEKIPKDSDPANQDVLQNLMNAFGDEGNRRLNYSEFIDLLHALNGEVLVQQFKAMEYIPGFITPQDFSKILLIRHEGEYLPSYLIKALHEMQTIEESFWVLPSYSLRSTKPHELLDYGGELWTDEDIEKRSIDALFEPKIPEFLWEDHLTDTIFFADENALLVPKRNLYNSETIPDGFCYESGVNFGESIEHVPEHLISLDQFLAFNTLISKIDEIELAIEIYTAAGGTVTKEQFGHATRVATGTVFSNKELDMVFRIFDVNKDGVLSEDALHFLYQHRQRLPVVAEKQQILSLIWSLALGTAAARGAGILVYPFDWLKTRLQLEPASLGAVRKLAKKTFAVEGWRGFLRGLNVMLVGIGPEKLVKLIVSDYVRQNLRPDPEDAVLWIEATAGLVTGVVQALVCNPYEQIKIQIQTGAQKKRNAYVLLYNLGIRNAFRGLSITLCRDVPFNVFYFSVFAFMKEELKVQREDACLTGPALFLAHSIAALCAVLVSAPADTVKTRYQCSSKSEYKNPLVCHKSIVAREGWDGLFKGTVARCLVTLQQWLQPGTVLGLKTWQQELDSVRKSRLLAMQNRLREEYGLDIERMVRAPQ
eukprot:TRINITY_DN4184_c0_g1_i2.p1 TRINITY_DN4184_c0_g1~~TRINITY_DN4184_c0_g1_i2.p1  ORF type:complete len:764 (+),score=145.85 TRINITY_DN4184_c0_g1_i2:64-2355(+)